MLIVQFLRATETGWLQLQMGVIKSGYWAGIESTIKFVIGSTGGKRCFEKNRRFLSPEFVSLIDELLKDCAKTE